jgi:hypothetical protein
VEPTYNDSKRSLNFSTYNCSKPVEMEWNFPRKGKEIFGSIPGEEPQSRQSTKLFSSRRDWDFPTPSPQASVPPPPFGSGGRGTLAGERGGGRVPIPMRGHTLSYSLHLCTFWYGARKASGRGFSTLR